MEKGKNNMKKYLYDYIGEVDSLLNNNKSKINDDVISNHLTKISFFQHERLIHLLVTLFYALLLIVFMALGTLSFMFYFISLIISIFLIFYIIHYFRLENGVQYLYKQYDLLLNKKS